MCVDVRSCEETINTVNVAYCACMQACYGMHARNGKYIPLRGILIDYECPPNGQ